MFARAALCCAVLISVSAVATGAQAQPVKGTATFSAADGFARLMVKLDEDVDTEVSVAGSVLVMRFKRPVDVAIGKVANAAPDYIASARRDPDGSAIRFALQRKVTVNTMSAGERTYVDLLPDGWSGLPPGLPQDVVKQLAERARNAERALRAQRASADKTWPIVRVRSAVQPTFVRYTFELPDGVGVSSAMKEQKLALSFGAPLTFDFADAKLAAPANIGAITQAIDGNAAMVEIALIGNADVRAFREDKSYVIDVVFEPSDKPQAPGKASAVVPPPAVALQSKEAPPRVVPDIAQPTSESIAQLVRQDIAADARKSEPKPVSVAAAPAMAVPVSKPVEVAPTAVAQLRPDPAPAAATVRQVIDVKRSSDALRLTFTFPDAVPAAVFRRADVIWLLLDWRTPIDLAPIRKEGGALIGDVNATMLEGGQAIRIRLNRPQLASLASAELKEGQGWTLTFADAKQNSPQPLEVARNAINPAHANITVPMAGAANLYRLTDPDSGNPLVVVTAPAPPRGFIRRQDFIEFALLETVHGVAVQPNADDLVIDVASDKVMVSRPDGLTLSPSVTHRAGGGSRINRPVFDPGEWAELQSGVFGGRHDALVKALANAPANDRVAARRELARFYLARGLYVEAKGLLDVVLDDEKSDRDDPDSIVMHAVASTLIGRPASALKDLASPAVAGNSDLQLWTGLALAQQGQWADAREKFKNAGFAITALPLDLQRIVLMQAMRASLEVKDFAGAASRMSELELVGIPKDVKPQVLVMRARLAEALGRDTDALADYALAAASSHRAAAADAQVRTIALRQKRDEIAPDEATRDLEVLAMTWRGDAVEMKTLQMLARLYGDAGRFGDALAAARSASVLQANSEIARQLQDDAAALFAQIFMSPKGDDIPPVEALAMFYENRELTPIGRRGDEMIRRLAERLVAVDLLDQAAELLQYQVDHRLEGAARAQVAARLAMVYLMNRKPQRAIAALHATRITDLAGELRQQRLLLEARAQSDIGRRDLALDIISNLAGREAIRLRSDIHWGARRWREASEQIELYYGDRWRDFKPLDAVEKSDVIRAVLGYALAEDGLGLARFREKYAPLMATGSDKTAFEFASQPPSDNNAEFARIAKMAAGIDTLDGFLREMKSRFPDAMARAPLPQPTAKADPMTTGTLPQIVGLKQQVEAKR